MSRAFRFGFQFRTGTADELRDQARRAEAACFDLVCSWEHVTDGWTALLPLLAMAEAAPTLRVCPMVINNDFHHPVHLAGEIASLEPVTGEATGVAAVRNLLERPSWWGVPAIDKALIPILTRLAAHYLTSLDRRGRALDRVAHFHLGSGAIVERINSLGDTSANGLRQSYGMMVNYRYKLSDVDANHEAYANGRVIASREVRALAKG